MFSRRRTIFRRGCPAPPESASCSAADWAVSPTSSTNRVEIPYAEIPGWPRSTAIGHAGKLVFGRSAALNLAVLSGRAHLYEGYSPRR